MAKKKLKPAHTGPGLFEHLDQSNVVPYTPGGTIAKEVPYELTAEDHEMFDGMVATQEEIEQAKATYKKLKGSMTVDIDTMDNLVDEIQKLWFDKVPNKERKITIYTKQAGLDLFHKYCKEQYGK